MWGSRHVLLGVREEATSWWQIFVLSPLWESVRMGLAAICHHPSLPIGIRCDSTIPRGPNQSATKIVTSITIDSPEIFLVIQAGGPSGLFTLGMVVVVLVGRVYKNPNPKHFGLGASNGSTTWYFQWQCSGVSNSGAKISNGDQNFLCKIWDLIDINKLCDFPFKAMFHHYLIMNPSLGMYQEIHLYGTISIGNVNTLNTHHLYHSHICDNASSSAGCEWKSIVGGWLCGVNGCKSTVEAFPMPNLYNLADNIPFLNRFYFIMCISHNLCTLFWP